MLSDAVPWSGHKRKICTCILYRFVPSVRIELLRILPVSRVQHRPSQQLHQFHPFKKMEALESERLHNFSREGDVDCCFESTYFIDKIVQLFRAVDGGCLYVFEDSLLVLRVESQISQTHFHQTSSGILPSKQEEEQLVNQLFDIRAIRLPLAILLLKIDLDEWGHDLSLLIQSFLFEQELSGHFFKILDPFDQSFLTLREEPTVFIGTYLKNNPQNIANCEGLLHHQVNQLIDLQVRVVLPKPNIKKFLSEKTQHHYLPSYLPPQNEQVRGGSVEALYTFLYHLLHHILPLLQLLEVEDVRYYLPRLLPFIPLREQQPLPHLFYEHDDVIFFNVLYVVVASLSNQLNIGQNQDASSGCLAHDRLELRVLFHLLQVFPETVPVDSCTPSMLLFEESKGFVDQCDLVKAQSQSDSDVENEGIDKEPIEDSGNKDCEEDENNFPEGH